MRHRFIYFFAAVLTIVVGISARAVKDLLPQWINLWLGDLLYAVMMYFIVAAAFARSSLKVKAITALCICFCIELSQLYRAEWINAVRATLEGRLILGSGFLWSDLIAYTTGVALAYYFDLKVVYRKKSTA
jgi:hypothetical protein